MKNIYFIFFIFILIFISCSPSNRNNNASNISDSVDVFTCDTAKIFDPKKTVDTIVKKSNTITDIENNVYKTVKIGNQYWMAEDLRVAHYKNGELLTQINNSEDWLNLTTGAFIDFSTTIRLYNKYAALNYRGIAPEGWHVSTAADWRELIEYVGGSDKAGIVLRSKKYWKANRGTDEFGFAATPGGKFNGEVLSPTFIQGIYWWSSTFDSHTSNVISFFIEPNTNTNSAIIENIEDNDAGISIRCVKD